MRTNPTNQASARESTSSKTPVLQRRIAQRSEAVSVQSKDTRTLSFSMALPVVRETSGCTIRAPADSAAILADLGTMAQECFVILTLNLRNRLIDRHLVTLGLADSSLVHPREVFRHAIMDGASAVILAHNHPSGDPTPSAEDLRITRQLVEAGRVVDIQILDHIIIGRGETPFISLREAGLIDFRNKGQ